MTDGDLRDLIRTELFLDEPRFAMSSRPAVEAGRRAVRRRRLAGITGASVLTVAALVLGASLLPDAGTTNVQLPPTTQRVLDEFDPVTFPDVVDRAVRTAASGQIPTAVEGRIEPTYDGVRTRPEDYTYTNAWSASYIISPTDRVSVLLRQDPSANEGSARRYCQQALASGDMVRCEAAALEDGSVTITAIEKVRKVRRGWGRVRGGDRPDTWWFARQVIHRRSYGAGVIAGETVKAPSLAAAERSWSLGVTALTRIATAPELVYKLPPPPENRCNTAFYMPRDDDGFLKVVCVPDGDD